MYENTIECRDSGVKTGAEIKRNLFKLDKTVHVLRLSMRTFRRGGHLNIECLPASITIDERGDWVGGGDSCSWWMHRLVETAMG